MQVFQGIDAYYRSAIPCIAYNSTLGVIHISVKTIQSLKRGLETVEAIADLQPIGLTALCEATGESKSAMQRTIATLHEAGWIQRTADSQPRWELSARLFIAANKAHRSSPLPVRARRLLTPLRDQTGETVHLALFDGRTIVVTDVAESTQTVRTALPVGQTHPIESSSAGRAILAHLSPAQADDLIQSTDNALGAADLADIRMRGWSSSTGAVLEGSNSVGAALLDITGAPVGAIVISGPATRLTADRCAELGELLSHSVRPLLPPS